RSRISGRKLRLFAVGCYRGFGRLFSDWRCRQAIEVAERFADREATEEELLAARSAIKVARGTRVNGLAHAVANANHYDAAWDAANYAIQLASRKANDEEPASAYSKASAELCYLLRDIIGNPFHPTTRQPDWLSWNGGAAI